MNIEVLHIIPNTLDCDPCQLHHLLLHSVHKIHFILGIWFSLSIQIVLEISKTQFIARLKPTVLLALLLDTIICQMDVEVVQVVEIELIATGPEVAFVVEVAFDKAIDRSDQ